MLQLCFLFCSLQFIVRPSGHLVGKISSPPDTNLWTSAELQAWQASLGPPTQIDDSSCSDTSISPTQLFEAKITSTQAVLSQAQHVADLLIRRNSSVVRPDPWDAPGSDPWAVSIATPPPVMAEITQPPSGMQVDATLVESLASATVAAAAHLKASRERQDRQQQQQKALPPACGAALSSASAGVPTNSPSPSKRGRGSAEGGSTPGACPVPGAGMSFESYLAKREALMQGFLDRQQATLTAQDVKVDALICRMDQCVDQVQTIDQRLSKLESSSGSVSGLVEKVTALEGTISRMSSSLAGSDEGLRRVVSEVLSEQQQQHNQQPYQRFASSSPAGSSGSAGPDLSTAAAQYGRGPFFSPGSIPSSHFRADAPSARFKPSKIYIRGWSVFGDMDKNVNGLPEEVLVPILEELIASIPAPLREHVLRAEAPFHRNWQGVIRFRDGTDSEAVWSVHRHLKTLPAMIINGKKLYPVVEQPAWERSQASLLKRAERIVASKRSEVSVKIDYSAAKLWSTAPEDLFLGGISRPTGQWKWSGDALKLMNATVADLDKLMMSTEPL